MKNLIRRLLAATVRQWKACDKNGYCDCAQGRFECTCRED